MVRFRFGCLVAAGLALAGCNKNTLKGLGPDIEASPNSLAYTASAFGGGNPSATLTVIVSNEGGGSLNIDEISFSPGTSTEFAWQFGGSTALPLRLAAGEWAAMQVVYSPTDLVQDTGTLILRSNDADEDPLEIPITTEALGPQLTCVPNPVTFIQAPGVPTSRSIACSNTGNQPLTVTGFEFAAGTSAEFASTWTLVPQTLDPGAPLNPFSVTYTPGELGNDAGQVLVHNDTGADYVIDLNGTGTDQPLCDLGAFPFFVNWGTVLLGTTVNKTVLVTNNGNGACHITSIAIGALTTEFTYGGPQTYTINPGASQILTVGYHPIDRWTDIGALNVNSDDPAEPTLGVLLTGNGGGPEIDVLPCPVDFGLVTVGCKVDRQVTIYNTGDLAMTVNSVTMAAGGTPEFSIIGMPATNIPPNGTATISLRLMPTTAGNKTRTLMINTNDGDEPVFSCVMSGVGTTMDHQTDNFMQPTSPQADILFVVDNSGSMGDEQQSLANSFQSFANFLVSQNASYQVGVTTTDISPAGAAGKLVGSPRIITNTTPNAAAEFAQNANVGTDGDSSEQGLEGGRLAVTPPLITGYNAGFVRATAKLFLVFVSDEEDQSPDGNGGQPASYFINAYRNVKGVNNPSLLSASAIAGPVSPDPPCSNAAPGERYKAVVDSIGGVWSTICTTNFGPALQAIGVEATAPLTEFFLTRVPIPATIVVRVNNVVQPGTAWSYNPTGNSIVFNGGAVPGLGAAIKVDYDVVCQMP